MNSCMNTTKPKGNKKLIFLNWYNIKQQKVTLQVVSKMQRKTETITPKITKIDVEKKYELEILKGYKRWQKNN